MKKVNVKDVDVTEVEEDTKKFDVKKLILLILIVITTLVGIFFWSTKVRWDAEIEEYHEILYYGQEEVQINELTDFYGEELSTEIKDTEALLMYCSSEYGKNCVTGDFNNSFENLLREPSIAINIVVLIDIVLLIILFKDKYMGNAIKTYIIFGIVLVLGLVNIGKVVYNFADYYAFVNDSKNVIDGEIIGQLVTENTSEYYPVVKYITEQGEFINYVSVSINGQVEEDLPDKNKITIYYDKNDNEVITIKQSLSKYILPVIVGVLYIVVAIAYLVISKRKKNE